MRNSRHRETKSLTQVSWLLGRGAGLQTQTHVVNAFSPWLLSIWGIHFHPAPAALGSSLEQGHPPCWASVDILSASFPLLCELPWGPHAHHSQLLTRQGKKPLPSPLRSINYRQRTVGIHWLGRSPWPYGGLFGLRAETCDINMSNNRTGLPEGRFMSHPLGTHRRCLIAVQWLKT